MYSRILNVLNDFAGRDWQLAALACKTIWNCVETTSTPRAAAIEDSPPPLNEEARYELIELLLAFTGTCLLFLKR
ncbi:unnamed protein product [Protopolystoma xenopodis]|uniref:Uncharacterized protein n=1 Tax=Protopolystoma xenopodis TaxID=117903 RepID=A0A3S5BV47_9PLAT|nr:unnamed protein product [Protopolystoma xenopodis]